MKSFLALAIFGWNETFCCAFSTIRSRLSSERLVPPPSINSRLSAEGFGSTVVKERPKKQKDPAGTDPSMQNMTAEEAKQRLMELIPRMTGKDEEYRTVEAYVNLLEEKYSPVQTIDFLNLAISGDWQLVSIVNLYFLSIWLPLSFNSFVILTFSAVIFNEADRCTKQKITTARIIPKNRSRWF